MKSVHVIIAGLDVLPPLSLHRLEDLLPFKTTLDLIKLPLPKEAYNKRSKKWHAEKILDFLDSVAKNHKKTQHRHILGIVDVDLYYKKPSVLFGLSEVGKHSVISISKLKPSSKSKWDTDELFNERVLKVAMHETGHAFGLGHCKTKRCTMFFTKTMKQLDNQLEKFCNLCKKKLVIKAEDLQNKALKHKRINEFKNKRVKKKNTKR